MDRVWGFRDLVKALGSAGVEGFRDLGGGVLQVRGSLLVRAFVHTALDADH